MTDHIDTSALRKQIEQLLDEYGSDMERAGGDAAAFERRSARMYRESAAETRAAILSLLDELDALRSRAHAVSGWQPIETAPKDGAQYILVTAGRGAWIAHWCPVSVSGYRFDQPWRSVMLNHNHIAPTARYLPPTHWMPLPAAPAALQQHQPGEVPGEGDEG